MNKELKIINEQEVLGKDFKIYGSIDEPLFLAKDVADWIEYDKSSINKMLNKVDEDEKVRNIVPTLGGAQEMWLLTENGLYEVLMQSRKPIAKTFKKEVKKILKQIRQTGGYIPMTTAQAKPMSDAEIMASALLIAQKTIEARDKALTTANDTIKQLKPKADYTDMVLQSKGLLNVTQIAQDYGMSAVAFNKLLEELGIQYRDKRTGQWILYGKYKKLGWVGSTSTNITRSDGTPDIAVHTKWTQKGRLGLYEILKKNGYVPIMESMHEDYINGN